MPRVLAVGHTAALGGAELALLRLCGALDPSLASVKVLLFEDGPLRERLAAGGHEVEVLPLRDDVRTARRDSSVRSVAGLASVVVSFVEILRFTARLTGVLRRDAPDLVHATTLKADLLCMVPAYLARVPLVWHVHDRISADYLPARVAAAVRVLARTVPRHVIVNSMATARTIMPPRGRWTLAYPGLVPEQVRPWDETLQRERAHAARSAPVVGIVGRLSATKGQRELIRAAPMIVAAYPHVQVRLVGAPLFGQEDHEAELRELVHELGLEGTVVFRGFAEDPVVEIDALSVLVHASPVPEPFGQCVAEGMGRGVPVVATRAGGVPEIVLPGAGRGGPDACLGEPRGLLVVPGDVDALAAAVLEVLDDPVGAHLRARAAWLAVQRQFMIDRTCAAVLRAWAAALTDGSARSRVRGGPAQV